MAQKRPPAQIFYPSDEERSLLTALATEADTTMSSWIRAAIQILGEAATPAAKSTRKTIAARAAAIAAETERQRGARISATKQARTT